MTVYKTKLGMVNRVIVDDVEKATALRLEYAITDSPAQEDTAYDYRVPLEYTECNFGGERP